MTHRLLMAAIKHETHVFKRVPTTLADFRHGYYRDERVAEVFRGTRLELGGFLAVAEKRGWTISHPLAVSTTPGGRVTDAAFAEFMAVLEEGLKRAQPLDGVLLALHGSMATESHDDAEGEILRRVRAVVGAHLPIGISLDPHSNVTRRMAEHANIIIAYRTNPHTDHFETGERVALVLARAMDERFLPRVHLARRRDLLRGFDAARTHTGRGPMVEALRRVAEWEKSEPGVLAVSVHSGYSYADFPEVGPSVAVTGRAADPRYQRLADELMEYGWCQRAVETERVVSVDEAMTALRTQAPAGKPLVLGDYGDAPGGGAYGDGTNLLAGLISAGVEGAVLAALYDPEAAAACVDAGVGGEVSVALGGKHDPGFGGAPLRVAGRVGAVSEGNYVFRGPYGTGTRGTFGQSVRLDIGGIQVILSSRNSGIYDQEQLRIFGIEPAAKSVLALKCMHGHKADFGRIASRLIDVDTGGLTTRDYTRFTYRKVPRPIWPLDPID
ncbi:MAG: M81 family metallopeptidase [Proteobacteria bacterium]|nr:M81 family metallopeptidase [Pseudomonadota bacterium]MBI3505664.1 M81 family metallopeptidase [Pseudomonadota bacterium]